MEEIIFKCNTNFYIELRNIKSYLVTYENKGLIKYSISSETLLQISRYCLSYLKDFKTFKIEKIDFKISIEIYRASKEISGKTITPSHQFSENFFIIKKDSTISFNIYDKTVLKLGLTKFKDFCRSIISSYNLIKL